MSSETTTSTESNQTFQIPSLWKCKDQKWYYFLVSCFLCQITGFILVGCCRIIDTCIRSAQIRSQNKKKQQGNIEESSRRIASPSSGVSKLSSSNKNRENLDEKFDVISEIKDWSGEIISGQNITGRCLVCLVFTLSVGSVVIYLYELTIFPGYTEICLKWSDSFTQQVDMAFNIVFLVYFFLRLLAANDKLTFWFEIYSFVELYTLPASFMSIYLNRYWIGLRFLRALRFMTLTDVLGFMNIVRSNNAIRFTNLVTSSASLILTAAGFILLAEWSGDPPFAKNAQNRTFMDFSYFMIVTISTVGYGDISCHTVAGKILIVLFIMSGLALFANSIPEIFEILGSRSKYQGIFRKQRGKQHVLLCGHITFESVSNFLGDFLHKDREDVDVKIVILDNYPPDLALRRVLKRYFTQVEFYQGSVMSTVDLTRVQLTSADACLILANKYCTDPDAEDASSIMRVISVKNLCPQIRVLVQLMQYHNKAHLMNIPSWDSRYLGDDVVCLAELRSGFLAQSCMAPGFSTMLANLFTMRSFTRREAGVSRWLNNYLEGAGMEMYSEHFSPSFHGLTFVEAVRIAFVKLQLLLVAVEINSDSYNAKNSGSRDDYSNYYSSSIAINPRSRVKIEPGMQGFFIAQSADESKRAFYYCHRCHGNLKEVQLVKPCQCDEARMFQNTLLHCRNATRPQQSYPSQTATSISPTKLMVSGPSTDRSSTSMINAGGKIKLRRAIRGGLPSVSSHKSTFSSGGGGSNISSYSNNRGCGSGAGGSSASSTAFRRRRFQQQQEMMRAAVYNPRSSLYMPSVKFHEQTERRFDSTGMFHWCRDRPIESVLFPTVQAAGTCVYSDHIVVCVFADANSPLLGLRNFVMPLRASNLHYRELPHIVFIANLDFMRREWPSLATFPRMSVLAGSPLCRANLRAVNVNMSRTCVIMTSKSTGIDTAALSAVANSRSNGALGLTETIDAAYLVDKEAILCSLNLQAMAFDIDEYRPEEFPELVPETANKEDNDSANEGQDVESVLEESSLQQSLLQKQHISKTGAEVQTITELAMDSNVQFLDQDDEDSPDTELFMTQPFACGRAFAVSVLDSLVSTAYFNVNALTLIRTLTTGGATPELEQVLAEGTGMRGGFLTPDTVSNRDRCKIQLLRIDSSPLSEVVTINSKHSYNYGTMFLEALERFGILCIGLYRLIKDDLDLDDTDGNNDDFNPIAITKEIINNNLTVSEVGTTSANNNKKDDDNNNNNKKNIEIKRNKSIASQMTDVIKKRYVITNPPAHMELQLSDLVYCLQPFSVVMSDPTASVPVRMS